jgi:hypothetical protein
LSKVSTAASGQSAGKAANFGIGRQMAIDFEVGLPGSRGL